MDREPSFVPKLARRHARKEAAQPLKLPTLLPLYPQNGATDGSVKASGVGTLIPLLVRSTSYEVCGPTCQGASYFVAGARVFSDHAGKMQHGGQRDAALAGPDVRKRTSGRLAS